MNNKSLIITQHDSGWINYVCAEDRADQLRYTNKKHKSSIIGKFSSLIRAYDFYQFLRQNKGTINAYNSVILVGNSYAFVAFFMKKVRLIKPKRVVWWGFYLHSRSSIRIYRLIRPFIEPKDSVYVLYSKYEKHLYANVIGRGGEFMTLPFGSWDPEIMKTYDIEDYYFSGGYSNRDYIPLIEAFRNSQYKLTIIASKLNVELNTIDIPSNVTIMRDVDKATFHEIMGKARGVIIPLKENLGSSGQMVVINAMARKKAVIINDNDIMKEYILNEESGLVIKDIKNETISAVTRLEEEDGLRDKLTEGAFDRFLSQYSAEPLKVNTIHVMDGIQQGS